MLRRIVIVDAGEGEQIPTINPVILEREGEARGQGGLSFLRRKMGLCYAARKSEGGVYKRGWRECDDGKEAACLRATVCHEVDHLEGQLFIDIMDEEIFDMEVEEGAEEDYDDEA